MAEHVLIDNDVALKIACYTLDAEIATLTTAEGVPPAMLGVGRFVIRRRIARSKNISNAAQAGNALDRLLLIISTVEASDDELALAADLESTANRCDLELDSGESQLLAILVFRAYKLLITGDKRAIAAMAVVAPELAATRIVCFEQLISHIVGMIGSTRVRECVCSEPRVDQAVTLCFSCSLSNAPDDSAVLAALASYIGHLNGIAPGVLLPGFNLNILTA